MGDVVFIGNTRGVGDFSPEAGEFVHSAGTGSRFCLTGRHPFLSSSTVGDWGLRGTGWDTGRKMGSERDNKQVTVFTSVQHTGERGREREGGVLLVNDHVVPL